MPKDTAENKTYHPPCIKDFGDLRKITQGSAGPAKEAIGSMPNPGPV